MIAFARALGALTLVVVALSACVTANYTFQSYEPVEMSFYRIDHLAFTTRGSASSKSEDICAVKIFSKFYDSGNKLAACGRLVDECNSMASRDVTEAWFAAAELYVAGDRVSSAAFFSQNLVGEGKGKATCVVTATPWQPKYAGAPPRFKGGTVRITY